MELTEKPRKKGFFQIDNKLVKGGYGRCLEVSDYAVYAALACYAFTKRGLRRNCFVGQDTVARHLGISERTVIRSIKRLIILNIVQSQKRVSLEGKRMSNFYTLIDRDEWLPPSDSMSPSPSDSSDKSRVSRSHTNKTFTNKNKENKTLRANLVRKMRLPPSKDPPL